MLLALAVILGIVLLQKFDSAPNSTRVGTQASAATTVAEVTTTPRRVTLTTVAAPPSSTTTTAKARAKADVKVLVANGAGVRGLGGSNTTILKNAGYTTLTPVDATAAIDKTVIQFADGYEAEAREVAQALGQAQTAIAKLSSPPVAAADLGDAKIVVILGADATSTTTTVAGAGGSTTTTVRR